MKTSEVIGHPNNDRHEKILAQKVAQTFFWQISGKNPSHPQKFACIYTNGVNHSFCRRSCFFGCVCHAQRNKTSRD